MSNFKFPPPSDAAECLDIRKRSKRGEYISPEQHTFCTNIYAKYEDWYNKTEEVVINETVPFGSEVACPQKKRTKKKDR